MTDKRFDYLKLGLGPSQYYLCRWYNLGRDTIPLPFPSPYQPVTT